MLAKAVRICEAKFGNLLLYNGNAFRFAAMHGAPPAWDELRLAGGGYIYFNPQAGHEPSGVLGFTYSFENQSTQYQNGVDMHFDWSASQFLTKQFQIGAVG
jgi:hypothetical protein